MLRLIKMKNSFNKKLVSNASKGERADFWTSEVQKYQEVQKYARSPVNASKKKN
jgi:hypothetical protein